jgi:NADH-quinone oxidoreductase subunit G
MGKITINGNEYEFKPGQTIIEVATENGLDIPHFCWHPSLSVSGNCRMCLVEVEKMPKLVIACSTYAAEGMVVNVNSEKSVDARKAVMEFILINHPLDCPICDEAGECKLQDYTFSHSVGESRFVEEKQHKNKRVQLGPRIIFDGERCISCSRCIRFSAEVAKKNQLTFVKRGDRVTINTFPGESFDNNYTLNTTDICPVGALTSKEFRFKSRVWEMSSTDSICIGCSRGCNTEIWVRNNEVLRLTPRNNPGVNSYWMCDKGRLETFKEINDVESRIEGSFVKEHDKLVKHDLLKSITKITEILKSYKASEIAFVASAYETIEDNYALLKLAKSLNIENIVLAEHKLPGDFDDILLTEDKTPNYNGAKLLFPNYIDILALTENINNGKIKAALMLDSHFKDEKVIEALSKLKDLVVFATNKNKVTELATVLLGISTYAEKNGTFLNGFGVLQRIKPAVATEEMDRSLDNLSESRWDKFGTNFDRWMKGKKYDVKPSWKLITIISGSLKVKFNFNMAEEVFNEASNNIKPLNGLDYDVISDKGVKLKF